jgi:hypothetical protein
MKIKDLIKIYGLPVICNNVDELKKEIEKSKEESFKYQVEWWILRFRNGKIFYYDPIKRNWENLENG